jgi:uncharacterized protein
MVASVTAIWLRQQRRIETMQYRSFGRLDWRPSALGFGAMRLPTLGAKHIIDEPLAIRMMRFAIDHGVNYIDTAYPYHGGQSEVVVGKALQDGYRDKVRLATKSPVRQIERADDFDRFLDEQLERLGVETIDYYLLHGMRVPRWETVQRFDILDRADKALADGKIRYMGFSFHDSFSLFREIIEGYDNWTFCQIQYNYMNETYQAGTEGLKFAAEHGLGVVIMEPLLGGRLVNPPDEVQDIWDEAPIQRTPAEWALSWLWSKPEVSLVLSGMSTMWQVVEDVYYASQSSLGMLSEDDLAIVGRARDVYNSICPIPCTQCEYCMPCPNGVNIPGVFALLNRGVMYNAMAEVRQTYAEMPESERASACIQCQVCEEKCPQDIPISQWMPLVHAVLGEGQEYDPAICPVV